MQLVAVLVAEQQLADQAVLDHLRRAPLARDHGAVVEVPPEVVGELLRPAVGLPGALDREVLVVEQEDAAGPVAVGVAERGDVDPVRAAVDGVRAAVAGLAGDLVGLDHLHELGRARVLLDVEHVDARASAARARAGSGARRAGAAPTGTAPTSTRSSRSGAARRRCWACRAGRRAGRSSSDPGSRSSTSARRRPVAAVRVERWRRRRASPAAPGRAAPGTDRSSDRASSEP